MGSYRVRDLLLVPGIVSLLRVPLGVVFFWVVERPALALAVLLAGGLTDVADGWYARRAQQVTATGAVLDGVVDKLFVGAVAAALWLHGKLNALALAALSVREIGETPLALLWAFTGVGRQRGGEKPRANALGKLTTTLQFMTLATVTVGLPIARLLLFLTFVVGTFAAVGYWARALFPRHRTA